jgi:hypothetical protein
MKIKNDNLAVSEVMGTILILCITVPFITSVYLATMALPPPSETPIVDIVGMTKENNNNIVFSNQGGNELPIETLVIFEIGGNQIVKTVGELLDEESSSDGVWNIGEELVFNYDIRGFHVESRIIDPYTNSVVWTGILQEGDYIRDPYALTLNATNIQAKTTTLNMRYNFWNESGTVSFSYRIPGDSWINTPWVAKSGESTYEYTLNGLVDDTIYEFKAQLQWASNLSEGDVKTFETDTPTILTLDATDIRTTQAKLWLQYDFIELSGSVSFSYREQGGSWIDSSWVAFSGQGQYDEIITGLTATTVYEFRARIQYDAIIKEGNLNSFTTWSIIMGWWHFSEGSGSTAYDSSKLNNHGTIFGSEWTTGVNTTALSFDGVDDYVRVYDSPSLDITEELSVEAWINPLENNEGFVGEIGDSVIDTSWFGPNSGRDSDILQIYGNVHCVAFRGDDDDGFIATIYINDTGLIKNVIDFFEFDTAYCYEPDIIHIANDIFAISYEGPGNDGFIKTMRIDNLGIINDIVIDTLEFDNTNGRQSNIIHIKGFTYAVAYIGPNDNGYVTTVEIDDTGMINDLTLGSSIFCTTETGFQVTEPNINHIANNIFAVVFRNADDDGEVRTMTILDSGQITSAGHSDGAYVDKFIFDVYDGWQPTMKVNHISSDIYAICYRGRDGRGALVTLNIDSNGIISEDTIDKLYFDDVTCNEPQLIYISNNYYGIVYRGVDNDGYLITVEISGIGEITDTIIDSFEFDTSDCYKPVISFYKNDIYIIAYTHYNEGFIKTIRIIPSTEISEIYVSRYCIFDFTEPDIVNVYNDIYAIVCQGLNEDGYLTTLQISDDGFISNNVIDVLEFDTVNGRDAVIEHVSGNIFAIAYRGPGDHGYLKTVEILNDGDIKDDSVIDTFEFDTFHCYEPDIIHISGNVYAIAYRAPGEIGYLKTVEITTGQITDTYIDYLEFESSYCYEPNIFHISGNIYAIAYRGPDDDGFLRTVVVMNNGDIVDTMVDIFEFDTSRCFEPEIINVYDKIYAIVYSRETGGGRLATVEIEDTGVITKNIIDTLRFDNQQPVGDDDGFNPHIIHIGEWVYAVVYRGEYNSYVKTMRIGYSGDISDVNDDYLLFDANGYEPQIIHINGDIYAIPYRGAGSNAEIKTVEIKCIEATWPRPIVYKNNAYGLQANSTTIYGYINSNSASASLLSGFNYVVLTYNRSLASHQIKLYINSVLQSEVDETSLINNNANNLIMGQNYNCVLDEVTIWNVALSYDQILANYNLYKP